MPIGHRRFRLDLPALRGAVNRLLGRAPEARDELLAGPIRGEPLGAEHLAERAQAVARAQRVAPLAPGARRSPLLTRLSDTHRILLDVRTRLKEGADRGTNVGPAGDWLLDNFYVVEAQIRAIRESLPGGYYRELPELAAGPLAGYPRIYELAITLISHTEGRIDQENLSRFVSAFQRVAPLSIGEVWAIPAMLRLALVESVRRTALRSVQRLDETESAIAWANRIALASQTNDVALALALERFISHPPPLTPTFVGRFLASVRAECGDFPTLDRLEHWLAEEGLTADEAAARSTQRTAITQLVMANSITSLRAVSRMNWPDFVEQQSRMEAVLRDDPSGWYARMTFATRDRYRHVVERIAKRTRTTEEAVARRVVDLARAAADDGVADPRLTHVGYYLIDDGLGALERAVGYQPAPAEALGHLVRRHPNVVLVGGIIAGTVLALAAMLWLAALPPAAWPLAIVFGFLPAADIAVAMVNQLVTVFLPPDLLPRLDLIEHGIPPEFRTAVVVPILLDGPDAVDDALQHLEVQFLANRDSHLHFALLSDFTDAPAQTRDGDAEILAAAVAGIRDLNTRYAGNADDAFYLFHRDRRWNPTEGVWMGWERKRGKLAQFNRFLRDGSTDAFSTIVGDTTAIRQARYVITLDADTILPHDAVAELIGTIAHPLNRAVYDPELGRVIRGYGILQPRVGISLPSAHRSRFAAVQAGHPGVDPYTTAVSDVYQDLYGEGSFTGKGIYDVETFELATHGRFPENRLLSHDLIEGNYARTGLATDINIYDDYPSRYLTFSRRKHRWIRGDWQLLEWLGPRVPGPEGREPNRLSLLSRWKVLDNLRRSLVEPAQLAFVLAGWTLLPGAPLRWTLLALGSIAAPWIVAILLAILRPPLDRSWRAYFASVDQDAAISVRQVALAVVFLPHEAVLSLDAIGRTLWRLFISHRRLLEWQPASMTERVMSGRRRLLRRLWPGPALGLLLAAAVAARSFVGERGPTLWLLAAATLPLALGWILSPRIAAALDAPPGRPDPGLSPASRARALRYALLHWRFFDRFVTTDTHWLAPDNYQEDPVPVLAMRTSPTNIGLQLLATVSAYHLGFLTAEEMTRRLERAFRALERVPRFRGHFYNWYDLTDLSILEPAYVSTVDSGNLAGHLIALRQALRALPDAEPPAFGSALAAALGLAEERLRLVRPPGGDRQTGILRAVAEAADALAAARHALPAPGTAGPVHARAPLERAYETLAALELPEPAAAEATEWIAWCLRLIDDHRRAGELGSAPLRRLAEPSDDAAGLIARLEGLANLAETYVMAMDFSFLADPAQMLLAVGYRPGAHALDTSYYDLLASEARLASFVAVAKNDLPVEHWFRLGRTLTYTAAGPTMVSWSGSMFEYLMPLLVMRSFPNTLLDQTCRGALARQIAAGGARAVPWGMSESAYNLRDRHLTYQYRAFGVPDLALKRGLGRDLVIAPYASALAAMIDPRRALANLRAFEARGALGPFGFRDALDYTRPDPGQRFAVVKTYMAHHIGMSLVALANALSADVWQQAFHADPLVRSAELLLHERVPRRLILRDLAVVRPDDALPLPEFEAPAVREIEDPGTSEPRVALLGRAPYTVMVSQCGGGYSRYENLAITRWRADGTRDDAGQFCYVRDLGRSRTWSAAHQPTAVAADRYRVSLATDRITVERLDDDIETRLEIAVVPDDAAEVRRVTLTNHGDRPRELELTSYGEVVLAPPDADRAHPAFGNLFVETEWHEWCSAITATRRPRAAADPVLWCAHLVDTTPERVGPVSCETDRARFIGRGRSVRDPIALETDGPLSGTTGAVLDPIFALRTRVKLRPGQSASVAFTTLVATTRARLFELADRYHHPHTAQRALDLAWTSAQVELRELNVTPRDAAVFQELAGHLFYGAAAVRASPAEMERNRGSRPLLWAQGISGDWPIVLATIESVDGIPTVRHLLDAHRYWRRRGTTVDLVILNARGGGYQQELSDQIATAVHTVTESGALDQAGGVFVRRRDLLSDEALLMLRATARLLVPCDGRSVGRIVAAMRDAAATESPDQDEETAASGRSERESMTARLPGRPDRSPPPVPAPASRPEPVPAGAGPAGGLAFDNGLGGLTDDNDYQIRISGDALPPAPWANVVANPHGGFVVSERGAGFTWAGSSYQFRLTPWHNDPVSDPPGDVLYLRDEETGELWSATPAPVRHPAPYTVRHGAGVSTFTHEQLGIATRLTLSVVPDRAIKCAVLEVTNQGTAARRLTLTAYAEWTLGVLREHTQHQVATGFDAERSAILARNGFEPEYASWVAFQSISEPVSAYTADRREFLGRNGALAAPAGLRPGARLEGVTGAGIDPCSALQCELPLAPGQTREIVVLLGAAPDEAAALAAMTTYRDPARARAAVAATIEAWTGRLSVVTVKTPERSFDAMLNRWTLYQAFACRMWARSAVYQSGGAYGFRDQLQDVMAFVHAEPGVAREHIVRAAGRQFQEGDVQHWWHPETGRGVRTRFSDDLVWLPYVVDHYVRVTGDTTVLDEPAPFLTAPPLEPGEAERYDQPAEGGERASVYEHCLRALRQAATEGGHGLPLIGGGDWNDGMNRVGIEGRGESVWLAWFLVATLRAFAQHAQARGEDQVAGDLRARADGYAGAIEAHGWDGAWYRRAYFDDGTPLGSAENEECRIDSIAQSWSVISGAGLPERRLRAMRALEAQLVRNDARLVMVLTPPFDEGPRDPGYIRGYVPGVRENGAQYTHAALWAVLATALRGDADRAFELFQMINPLTHADTPEGVATYKVEPYVVAADVYTAEGHVGRGGWTWYTGSASWMYRVGLETILGFTRRGNTLRIEPRVPASWPGYSLTYRHGRTTYTIEVREPATLRRRLPEIVLDGRRLLDPAIPLVDDGAPHTVVVRPRALEGQPVR